MLAPYLVDIISIPKFAVSHSKYLIERWHRSRGHDQSNADDRVAVESIGIGHHYDACYGQDSSYYLYRERERERERASVSEGWTTCCSQFGEKGTLSPYCRGGTQQAHMASALLFSAEITSLTEPGLKQPNYWVGCYFIVNKLFIWYLRFLRAVQKGSALRFTL